jgi:nucleotide-binding universal stress UspA family protein
MYEILLPVDDDEDRAATQTAHVVDLPLRADEVRVTLTHVLHGAEKRAPEPMRTPQRVGTVRQARDQLEDVGIAVRILEAGAPPAQGILELAAEVDADLIVLGGRKRSATAKVVFGSTTQQVIRETDLPVTVTGGASPGE